MRRWEIWAADPISEKQAKDTQKLSGYPLEIYGFTEYETGVTDGSYWATWRSYTRGTLLTKKETQAYDSGRSS